jgi:endonuclease/exonuclease/phosphatase family metal-dependent hydrolase
MKTAGWRTVAKLAAAIFIGGVGLVAHAATVGASVGEWLTVATYNVQNYTLADRRLADGGFRPEYPKPEVEKKALRAVIRALDADVIALQEVGGPSFLNELRRDLAAEGVAYPFGEAGLAADESRGLAVLSRVPLGRVTLHRDLKARRRGADEDAAVRRGLLEVEVPAPGGAITVFVVHLKSRVTEDKEDPAAEDLRVAEAQAARDRVLERFPEPATARFLIVGDFNDTPGSRTLKAMQARGKTDIATWLDAADERGHRWTHAYARIGVYSRFDQALVAEGLRQGEPANVVARVAGEPWAEVAAASDHRPLVVRERTRPAQAAGTVD